MRRLILTCVVVAAMPAIARAADPKYEYKDVEKVPTVDVKKPTVWGANMTLGFTWVDGNAYSLGVTGTALLSVKHYHNELTFSGGGAYVYGGVSKYGTGGPITSKATIARNGIVKGRYDRYFLERNTVFASFQSSGDRFAGIWYRIEPQAGYSRLIFKSIHQLFRGEIGYDYTFEHQVGIPGKNNAQYHMARLFLFYENKFTTYAAFSEGLEILEGAQIQNGNTENGFRLNSLTSLSSALYKNIALKLNFKLAFNNNPPLRPPLTDPVTMMPFDGGHFEKVDTQLDVVLAVTFL